MLLRGKAHTYTYISSHYLLCVYMFFLLRTMVSKLLEISNLKLRESLPSLPEYLEERPWNSSKGMSTALSSYLEERPWNSYKGI